MTTYRLSGKKKSPVEKFKDSLDNIIDLFYRFGSPMGSQKDYKLLKYKEQLEALIKERTDEILDLNKELVGANEQLYTANEALTIQRDNLELTLNQLKDTQNRLIQSEKMASLGVLVAGIAHEINNPVNFISSGIFGLKENLDELFLLLDHYKEITPENVTEKLQLIHDSGLDKNSIELIQIIQALLDNISTGVNRTVDIIKGLRDFARNDDKTLSLFDIHSNIETALLMLNNKYKNRITIIKNYGDLPEIEGFPGQINQVFMNLLSNAIDSISDTGTITLSTQYIADIDKVRISVSDTGGGIKDEIVNKIFDPFFSTKPTGAGMGLGLSISYNIIKNLNGEIEVIGNYGKGAEFILTLPLKQ
jgi:signal transduction histidine kinase